MDKYELRQTIKQLIEQIKDKDKLVDELVYLFYEEQRDALSKYSDAIKENFDFLYKVFNKK